MADGQREVTMSQRKTGQCGDQLLAPKYRADCADFYREPKDTLRLNFRAPSAIVEVLEKEAERTDRTFMRQLQYVIEVCRGSLALDLNDQCSVEDWRAVLGKMEWYSHEGRCWMPFSVVFHDSSEAPRVS